MNTWDSTAITFKDRGTPLTDADEGRFAQTKDPFDMHRFKVPTLRNIALTAPYFHDASAKELKDAVSAMLKYQSNVKQPAQKMWNTLPLS